MSYKIADDGKSITCLRCEMTSHHPGDIEYLYCGHCHMFHIEEFSYDRPSRPTDDRRSIEEAHR